MPCRRIDVQNDKGREEKGRERERERKWWIVGKRMRHTKMLGSCEFVPLKGNYEFGQIGRHVEIELSTWAAYILLVAAKENRRNIIHPSGHGCSHRRVHEFK